MKYKFSFHIISFALFLILSCTSKTQSNPKPEQLEQIISFDRQLEDLNDLGYSPKTEVTK